MRKFLMTVLAAALIAGVTPVLAQPTGTWDGEGDGWCPFPIPYPSEYMKPWQTWKGRLEENPDEVGMIFKGDWYDGDGNHGTFKGEATLSSVLEIYCTGEWYWLDERFVIPVWHLMGPFSMKFKRDGSSCKGEWKAYDFDNNGTMEGAWVEP